MLVTMLARSLCLTFHSPNQRNSPGWEGKKPASAGFLLAIYSMIYSYSQLFNPAPYEYGSWLLKILPDQCLVINGGDFGQWETERSTIGAQIKQAVAQHGIQSIKIDLSMNPLLLSDIRIAQALDDFRQIAPTEVLHTDYSVGNNAEPNYKFFPAIFWIYSTRYEGWAGEGAYDAGTDKTRPLMSLNRQPRFHRVLLFNEFCRRRLFSLCDFSFVFQVQGVNWEFDFPYLNLDDRLYFTGNRNLLPMLIPGEQLDFVTTVGDISVNRPVYHDCAVNLVTETSFDMPWFSEKICKPFVANQIPIIVGPLGINAYLKSTGLDMFDDIVPWHTWDHVFDLTIKIRLISQFVEQWLLSGNVLQDYNNHVHRIRKNKEYFHSQEFRDRVMPQF